MILPAAPVTFGILTNLAPLFLRQRRMEFAENEKRSLNFIEAIIEEDLKNKKN